VRARAGKFSGESVETEAREREVLERIAGHAEEFGGE
jgi:hypothetical protein